MKKILVTTAVAVAVFAANAASASEPLNAKAEMMHHHMMKHHMMKHHMMKKHMMMKKKMGM